VKSCKQGSGNGKKDEKDEALAVRSDQSNWKKGRDLRNIEGWNCGRVGSSQVEMYQSKKIQVQLKNACDREPKIQERWAIQNYECH